MSKEKKITKNSTAGNWTRVIRVTGGYTNHYTTAEDIILLEDIIFMVQENDLKFKYLTRIREVNSWAVNLSRVNRLLNFFWNGPCF